MKTPSWTAPLILAFSLTALDPALFATDPDFGDRQDLGVVEHDALSEASGLAASRQSSNVLWTHNDKGGEADVFALSTTGKHLGVYHIEGVAARDWEDMAIGPGPLDNQHYLYVGDIGDNQARQDFKFIYRIPEPPVDANQSPVEATIAEFERLIVQYPDGKRDAETLMVDPWTKDIYLVSKQEDSVRVYRAAFPQSTSETIVLEHGATLDLKRSDDFFETVAGDISPSGLEILIKTYGTIYYWCRTSGQSIFEALAAEPVIVPYIREPQGEAVAWAADSTGYFTVSEEANAIPAHVYFYPRKKTTSVPNPQPHLAAFQLFQNYPNPFNPETTIRFSLANTSKVSLEIYDLNGRSVAVLVDGKMRAGEHSVVWQASLKASGVYIYRLQVDGFAAAQKLILVK